MRFKILLTRKHEQNDLTGRQFWGVAASVVLLLVLFGLLGVMVVVNGWVVPVVVAFAGVGGLFWLATRLGWV